MPHCIIECSEDLAQQAAAPRLLQTVHQAAFDSGLFQAGDIKCRLVPLRHYLVGGQAASFIHIACHIMAGRNAEQRSQLAKRLVAATQALHPEIAAVSCEIHEMLAENYSKR
ncbi:5-carboxymethyl-2-hydroxymuconate Delta-isomerase [Chromobacterium sp. IIBBL 290-4]|uniref:5-carboxymethyl-2-hydroxymuconate Delta-isomerase n=1 Tax=Chromobacterium sp. IIBBL 290-4 TaxID=2953890 RepID=UPI0020B73194|nr:5-carboxymethyl-2-hydroxymuconate Delta-isomerase [Chromobacterium sp. IIBBL 290-4]UTH75227.1 5-carboxymethyl-2-hydroxymuconate Delta-isomerase [Chromobacterium sp. IIBBL 290-4]